MKRLLSILAVVGVIGAPILLSPDLRAGMAESLPEIGRILFPKNLWRDVAVGMAFSAVFFAVMAVTLWLENQANWYSRNWPVIGATGWKRNAFVALSLLEFVASAGVWVPGVLSVVSYAGETAPDGQALSLLVLFTMLFGGLTLILAKPAYWAVRVLIRR